MSNHQENKGLKGVLIILSLLVGIMAIGLMKFGQDLDREKNLRLDAENKLNIMLAQNQKTIGPGTVASIPVQAENPGLVDYKDSVVGIIKRQVENGLPCQHPILSDKNFSPYKKAKKLAQLAGYIKSSGEEIRLNEKSIGTLSITVTCPAGHAEGLSIIEYIRDPAGGEESIELKHIDVIDGRIAENQPNDYQYAYNGDNRQHVSDGEPDGDLLASKTIAKPGDECIERWCSGD